jgi:metal-dependent amidase/aminoacylase/carboxypeptidase family protein
MSDHGFSVTPHYHLQTAWEATYTQGEGGRIIGINSEMDALPGIGHACGHNLIAISGVAVACAIKATMKKFSINGKIVLLGTPGRCLLLCIAISVLIDADSMVRSGRRRERKRCPSQQGGL